MKHKIRFRPTLEFWGNEAPNTGYKIKHNTTDLHKKCAQTHKTVPLKYNHVLSVGSVKSWILRNFAQ